MKIEEMMQPLEEDELEEVSGGTLNTITRNPLYQCRSCGNYFFAGENCPSCGGTLDYLGTKNYSGIQFLV